MRNTKSNVTNITSRKLTDKKRFETSYTKTERGCWVWNKTHFPNGYGLFSVKSKTVYAHRYSFELNKGPIGPGEVVRHRCDVKNCVNPAHLDKGSLAENSQDMVARGRSNKGKTIKQRRLTETQRKEVFVLLDSGSTAYRVAKLTGISEQTISYLKKTRKKPSLSLVSKKAKVAEILEGFKEDIQDAIERTTEALGRAA